MRLIKSWCRTGQSNKIWKKRLLALFLDHGKTWINVCQPWIWPLKKLPKTFMTQKKISGNCYQCNQKKGGFTWRILNTREHFRVNPSHYLEKFPPKNRSGMSRRFVFSSLAWAQRLGIGRRWNNKPLQTACRRKKDHALQQWKSVKFLLWLIP